MDFLFFKDRVSKFNFLKVNIGIRSQSEYRYSYPERISELIIMDKTLEFVIFKRIIGIRCFRQILNIKQK